MTNWILTIVLCICLAVSVFINPVAVLARLFLENTVTGRMDDTVLLSKMLGTEQAGVGLTFFR